MENTNSCNITVYRLTKENMENIYYTLVFKGYTIHPYGEDDNKTIGIAQKETQEIIVKVGDFIMIAEDKKEDEPIPIMKNDFNIENLLSKYGQLLIKE